MNKNQQTVWVGKLAALEERITEMKLDALREFPQTISSHPLASALAAIECLAWATGGVISRFPTEEQINRPDSF